MEAWLVAVACEGSLAGARREVRLPEAGATIGRDPSVELALPDGCASLRHARVCRSQTGFTVEDLGSRHGTRLNGRLLEAGVAVPLRHGDELELGTTRVRLWVGDPLALPDARGLAAAIASRLLGDAAEPARLAVVDGPSRGRTARLPDGAELRLGRGPACDLCLGDPRVSRLHAAITRRGDRVRVRDLGSRNGLRVDGRPVRGEAELGVGALLELGGSRLRLEPGEPATGLSAVLQPAPRAGHARAAAVPWLLVAALCSAGLALFGGM